MNKKRHDTQDNPSTVTEREDHMSSQEYQESIRETRRALDSTLVELESRISSRQAWNWFKEEWGGEARAYMVNLGRSVRTNPIPTSLMAVSLVWLMASDLDGSPKSERHRESGSSSGMGDKAEHARDEAARAAAGMKSKVQSVSENVQDRSASLKEKGHEIADDLREKTERVRHQGRRLGDGMRQGAGDIRDRGREMAADMSERGEQMRRSGRRFSEAVEERGSAAASRPEVLAAVGLLAGSLLAWSLPITRKEEEVMAERSRHLQEEARARGEEKLREGKEAAAAAGDAFKDEMER